MILRNKWKPYAAGMWEKEILETGKRLTLFAILPGEYFLSGLNINYRYIADSVQDAMDLADAELIKNGLTILSEKQESMI